MSQCIADFAFRRLARSRDTNNILDRTAVNAPRLSLRLAPATVAGSGVEKPAPIRQLTHSADDAAVFEDRVPPWLSQTFRSLRRNTDVDIGFDFCRRFVVVPDSAAKVLDRIVFNEVHRATTKAATRHPGAVYTFVFPRELDHLVQLYGTHFVISAQTFMRQIHQFAKSLHVSSLERCGRSNNARIFRDHVTATFVNNGRELPFRSFQLFA